MTASLGEELDAIGRRLDATTDAWAAAGYPYEGPVFEAREAVYADLRDWNRRVVDAGRKRGDAT